MGAGIIWREIAFGGIEGFNTELTYYPDDRLTVVVLGNVNGVAPSEIAAKLSAVVHGEAVRLAAERKEVQVAAQVLAKCAGTYEMGPGVSATVTVEGGRLMTQLTGGAEARAICRVGDQVLPEGSGCAGGVLHGRERSRDAPGGLPGRSGDEGG